MKYFLTPDAVLKWLEMPSVYHMKKDELYELDDESFEFLRKCSSDRGCSHSNIEFIDYCLKEGILTTEAVSLKRPPATKAPEPSLRYLELQITDKCNLRCKHCFIGARTPHDLLASQIRNIMGEFEELQGLRVLITGGEPLMHPRFDEINEMLPAFHVRKILFTNGLMLNKQIFARLNVHEVQISIDGLQEGHDALRGKGTFRAAIAAVKGALDSGFEVSVATMVHPKNLQDFDEMERLFRGIGIKDWTVDVPCLTGRLKAHREVSIDPESGGGYLRYGFGGGFHSGGPGFGCGIHLMAVLADGRIAKCTFYGETPAGTIDEGLRACWKRIKPVRLDELKCDCEYLESCRGGCRYRALLLGDPLGKDLYKCRLYDIIKSNPEKLRE